MSKNAFTHIDDSGKPKIVDISHKSDTLRTAIARGFVKLQPHAAAKIDLGNHKKGSIETPAELAGIMGAKKTSELIPLCHNILLSDIKVNCERKGSGYEITATAASNSATGVEMEALTAVSIAALTIYDMCKGLDPDIIIENIQLLEKHGGKKPWKR